MSDIRCSGERTADSTIYRADLGSLYVTLTMRTTLGGPMKNVPTTVYASSGPYDPFGASGDCLVDLDDYEESDSKAGFNIVGDVTCDRWLEGTFLNSVRVYSLRFAGISP